MVDAAPAARRLLDEMQSPSLRIVFDAANLGCTSPPAQREIVLLEAMTLLSADIAIAHAKDFALEDSHKAVAAGTDALDYPLYLSLLKQGGFSGPLILHGLAEWDVAAAVLFLKNQLRTTRAIPGTRLS